MPPHEQIEREGQQHYAEKRFDKALESLEALAALGRTEPMLRYHRAQCLYYLRRAPEAAEIMRDLLAEEPSNESYRIILAQYVRALGNFDESLALLTSVSATIPGYSMLMGWHHMRLGDFLGGFRILQHERGTYKIDDRLALQPEKRLQRGMEIAGKTIFLALEGGFGDEVLSIRFAPMLERRGAKVIVGASPRLLSIFNRAPYLNDVRDILSVKPEEYDYYIPAILILDVLDITNPSEEVTFPYLKVDEAEATKWGLIVNEAAQGNKKIGLHWQGDWHFDYLDAKSPPAKDMLRFAELGRLFNLQRDAGPNTLPPDAPIFDSEAGPPSWERTLAVISHLDYVVSNDTSTAHMAAALGKKTLVLVPHAPHHYWLPISEKSLWYPSMHVFQQPSYGDWEGAVMNALSWLKKDIA